MAVSLPGTGQLSGLLSGWRGLARFWGAVLSVLALTAIVLQVLGPPAQPPQAQPRQGETPVAHAVPVPATPAPAEKPQPSPRHVVHQLRPGRDTPGPVAEPDPALMEPVAGSPGRFLPRISIDGRAPMNAYAAGFDPSTLRPRVGLLIAGIGMSEAESMAAIKNLPGGVTLAVSPYAGDLSRLLAAARLNEHEYLLSIPMEPQGYPVNDPDDRVALMTSLPPAENTTRLEGILARLTGYVGVTNILGPMRGERMTGMTEQFDPVLEEVTHRGLLFVDARTGQKPLPHAWTRSADMVVDAEPVDAADLDHRLDALAQLALDKGSALGVVSVPRPVTVERVAAWANKLASRGLALAPVSALVAQAPKQDQSPKQEQTQ